MPAKKKSVTTPLHLLQQLSHSLIEHLDKACSQAIKDAEGALAKLQKQRGKAQDKLIRPGPSWTRRAALASQAQTKARARLGELEESLTLLQTRQSETELPGGAQARRRAQPEAGAGHPSGCRCCRPGAARSSAATKPAAARRPASPRRRPPSPTPLRPELPQPRLTMPQQKPARPRLPPSLRQNRQPRLRPNRLRSARQCRGQARHDGASASKAPAVHVRLPVRRHPRRRKKTAASAEAPDKAAAAKPATKATAKPVARKPAASAPPLSQQPAPAESAAPRCAGLPARRGCALPGRGFPARRRQRRSKASLADLLQPFEQFALGLQFQRFQRFTQAV